MSGQNSDALVEAVARALVPVCSGSQEDMYGADLPDRQFDDLTPDWQQAFLGYAQAAIAAARPIIEAQTLERAARVAEETPSPWDGDDYQRHAHCVESGWFSNGCDAAAEHLRSLKGGTG